jgi:hypothetical protein
VRRTFARSVRIVKPVETAYLCSAFQSKERCVAPILDQMHLPYADAWGALTDEGFYGKIHSEK